MKIEQYRKPAEKMHLIRTRDGIEITNDNGLHMDDMSRADVGYSFNGKYFDYTKSSEEIQEMKKRQRGDIDV